MELAGLGDLLGVKKPWFVRSTEVQHKTNVLDIYIDFERGTQFPCPCCDSLSPVYDSSTKRIRHLDIFEYRSYLNIKSPRINCKQDGIKVIHYDPWSRKGTHYSLKFEAFAMRLCKEMSMSAVSKELGEPDTNLWRVFHHFVKWNVLEKFDFKAVKRVCVDETAIKRGHKYVSIFTDYDTGQVLFVTDGRAKEVFQLFYGWLWDQGGHPSNIELFSMDMSVSYQAGRREYFGRAEVVFDRFHIKKGMNKALDEVRKQEVQNVESLKKTKYIWLKNEINLTDKQKIQLDNFLDDSSLNTALAYKVKIEFDQLWNVQKLALPTLVNRWATNALALNLKPITRFIQTFHDHYDGIMKSIKTGITNAVSEGLNSLMQLAKTRARGYRNSENFKAMIYYLGNPDLTNTH